MKAKLVLLLLAAMGSTALVASAQTPSPAYVITSTEDGQAPNVVARMPVPPQPPIPPVSSLPDGVGRNVYFTTPTRPQVFTFSAEEKASSHQVETIAQQLAAANTDSVRESLKHRLVKLLEHQFDQRQKRHEEEIKQLEAQIKKLKELVEKRQENRREIIARRLDQIIKESQGLGW